MLIITLFLYPYFAVFSNVQGVINGMNAVDRDCFLAQGFRLGCGLWKAWPAGF